MTGSRGRRTMIAGFVLLAMGCSGHAADNGSGVRGADPAEIGVESVADPVEVESLADVVYAATGPINTLDPALAYDMLNYSILDAVCGRLVVAGSEPGETVLELAQRMTLEPMPDGHLRYKFSLLPDATFHNGEPVGATDVVYSLVRMLDPQTGSPGAPMFSDIVGYPEPEGSGIWAEGDDVVVIEVSSPTASFLSRLSTTFGCIIPEGDHERDGFDRQPVSAGPYTIAEPTTRSAARLVRFDAFREADRFPIEQLSIQGETSPFAGLAGWTAGKVDLLGPFVSAETQRLLQADSAISQNLYTLGWPVLTYLTMNTRLAPFDSLEVRQAVNYGLDRPRIATVSSPTAIPAYNVLPPSMPGYDPERVAYSYDLDRALELMDRAGRHQTSTVSVPLYYVNEPNYRMVAEEIQRQLRSIGLLVRLEPRATDELLIVAGDPDEPGMILSGGLSWAADYADPSNFYYPLFSVESDRPGTYNWSHSSAPRFDAMARKADQTLEGASELRFRRWADVFDELMTEAPIAPLYYPSAFALATPEVGSILPNSNSGWLYLRLQATRDDS